VRRRSLIAVAALVVAILAFFFYVPVVPMTVFPCLPGGPGYVSLSYYLFFYGETVSTAGQWLWLTQSYANCV